MNEITAASRLQTLEQEILERKGRIAKNILENWRPSDRGEGDDGAR